MEQNDSRNEVTSSPAVPTQRGKKECPSDVATTSRESDPSKSCDVQPSGRDHSNVYRHFQTSGTKVDLDDLGMVDERQSRENVSARSKAKATAHLTTKVDPFVTQSSERSCSGLDVSLGSGVSAGKSADVVPFVPEMDTQKRIWNRLGARPKRKASVHPTTDEHHLVTVREGALEKTRAESKLVVPQHLFEAKSNPTDTMHSSVTQSYRGGSVSDSSVSSYPIANTTEKGDNDETKRNHRGSWRVRAKHGLDSDNPCPGSMHYNRKIPLPETTYEFQNWNRPRTQDLQETCIDSSEGPVTVNRFWRCCNLVWDCCNPP